MDAPDPRPISPAQIALFETPHLQNISQAETLDYGLVREGPGGFADTVAMHIRAIRPDGAKDVSFDFLTGPRRVPYPGIVDFHGNPLLMLILERDVQEMKATLGLSATYFRNRIRQALVDQATLAPTEFTLAGKPVPAQVVTVQPFADDPRLERLPTVRQKTYAFVFADAVPGMLAETRISMPGDAAAGIPAASERITFEGVGP